MSRASLRRKGPRSGLSREGSGSASGDFLARGALSGEGLARDVEGEGEGGRRVAGELRIWGVASPGTEICSGGAFGGVLTETRPGMVVADRD